MRTLNQKIFRLYLVLPEEFFQIIDEFEERYSL
jgi:hypothetical protein